MSWVSCEGAARTCDLRLELFCMHLACQHNYINLAMCIGLAAINYSGYDEKVKNGCDL